MQPHINPRYGRVGVNRKILGGGGLEWKPQPTSTILWSSLNCLYSKKYRSLSSNFGVFPFFYSLLFVPHYVFLVLNSFA